MASVVNSKRIAGIEPATKAWEAFVLPLNYIRLSKLILAGFLGLTPAFSQFLINLP